MSENIQLPRVNFFNLDVLRFISVLMVMIYHGHLAYCGWFHFPDLLTDGKGNVTFIGNLLDTFALNSEIGVDMFFVISGFLITYILLKEREAAGKINIINFYIRRTLRIWPLYFLIVFAAPLIASLGRDTYTFDPWVFIFAENFHLIKTNGAPSLFVHFWSVCIEEHFYILWPLVIAFVPVKKLPAIFMFVIAASILFRFFAVYELPGWRFQVIYNTLSRIDVIVIGCWIAYIHYRTPIQLSIAPLYRILVIILFVFALCVDRTGDFGGPFGVGFKKYFYVFGFVFIFCNYLFDPRSFFNFKRKTIFHYLGKISYGIYIYHNILFSIIVKRLMYSHGITSFSVFCLLYFGIVITLSVLSYELFEKRLLKFKERFAVVQTDR